MSEKNEAAKRLEMKYKLIGYGIFGLIVIGIVIWLASCMAGTPETPAEKAEREKSDREITAFVCAQSVLEDYLKSPSSADYPIYEDEMVTNAGLRYTVNSYVDAENSFGAKIRNNFTVILEFTDDAMDRYVPKFVEIDGDVYLNKE